MELTNEKKLIDILSRIDQHKSELDFMLKHTARIAAWHQSAKDDIKHLKEVIEELVERKKTLESEV